MMMNRQMSGGGGSNAKMMNFGKSRAKMSSPDDKKVTFKDVAGLQAVSYTHLIWAVWQVST